MDSGLIVPFGRYVLKERLAQGGMGEVFRAVAVGEHGFEKPVVVKRVLPSHAGREDLTELFLAEAKLMTRLSHPNIVEVLDFGRGEHQDYYLVLELVDGADLGRLLRAFAARGEPFPVPLALFIASQVLRGLHHAHTKSAGQGAVVIHRDVSPSNVLCSTEGEVKVADFGVALVTQAGDRLGRNGVAGKPGYMAPEQSDGGEIDARADVFSAGVVLQQMLTGELPFRGETVDAQQIAARRGEREPARARRGEVGEAIEAILSSAMAPLPDGRFPDARAMAQAIEGLRDQGQPIASGDDLAEAVRAAQRELPAPGRRVIALTGASTADPRRGPSPGPEHDEGPRELTRGGEAGGVGAFTLRLPVRADATTRQQEVSSEPGARAGDRWSTPEPRTERIAADLPPASVPGAGLVVIEPPPGSGPRSHPAGLDGGPEGGPKRRALGGAALVVVLVAALIGVLAFAVRTPPAGALNLHAASGPAPSLDPPGTSSATVGSPLVLEGSSPPRPAPTAVDPAVAAAPSVMATQAAPDSSAITPPRVQGHWALPRPAPSVASPSPAAAPVAPAQDCAGDVAFFSNEAWVIRGGPRSVESPSTGVWPCGTYPLVAHSRLDPTQVRSATLVVGPKRRAVFDLR